MTNKEHLDRHLELCKQIYLRMLNDGTLQETLDRFAATQAEKEAAETKKFEVFLGVITEFQNVLNWGHRKPL